MKTEFYKKYRPRMFKDMLGQEATARTLMKMVKRNSVPHFILFTGPSGCGKTTFARILSKKLECGKTDFWEINSADFRGIDMVREIRNNMSLAPISGKVKVYLIDEAQKLTSDAQGALLKMLEDTPEHVYFFFATTDPQKLLSTIKTRATEVKVASLGSGEAEALISRVMQGEGLTFGSDVVDKLVELGEGSARKALVLLNQIAEAKSDKEALKILQRSDASAYAINIARVLINPGCQWSEVSKLLKQLEDEPETVRRTMLGYASKIILGGGKLAPRAVFLVDVFSQPFYDTGFPGLVAACYAVSKERR